MKKLTPTFNLTTFGCQMNYADSERIMAVLAQSVFKKVSANKADLFIFNLCSVRQHAIDRIWGLVNKIKKQNNKNKKRQQIILTGCLLSADKKKFNNKGILVLDIKDLNSWSKILLPYLRCKQQDSSSRLLGTRNNIPIADYLSIKPKYSSKFTAYVPIMTGCNNYCSYCAVPYTRGPEYSRPVAEIITEIKKLIVNGYREIILLGQNVNSYNSRISTNAIRRFSNFFNSGQFAKNSYAFGKKDDIIINFPRLLNMIDAIPGNYWLSFLTSHPKDMSSQLIKCFSQSKHLMPYLHLAIQSGSNKILKAMNRKYTVNEYSQLIKKVRQANPQIILSTDVIVGFPGETESDLKKTAIIMKKIKFDMVFLAKYSPRPGTVAAKLKDNVSADAKEKRFNLLNDILKKTALAHNQKLISRTLLILVDKIDKNKIAFGHTNGFKHVKIRLSEKNKKLVGQFVKVKINNAGAWSLAGDEIKNKTALK